jgi:hypothetical protein
MTTTGPTPERRREGGVAGGVALRAEEPVSKWRTMPASRPGELLSKMYA